ncbi:MAG: HD domain-containing protein [Thermotogae bacterium]|nr:HD domain-containing protein [Thermotogota bacterium]
MKHIQDPIYDDFIELDDMALAVVSHPYFQRMRRIMHLGLAHYVYPGATHSRFSHMLGTYHLSVKFLNNFRKRNYKIPKELYDAVRLGALLHDVGHTSLSHALEFTLLPFRHEEMGLALINSEFRKVLGDSLSDLILDVFRKKVEPFAYELVESQMDVDRLDYLRRDAYYCGVDYGLVDVERIVQTSELYPMPQGRTLVIVEKGMFAVESYIIARYLMYWSVYYHKTNLSFQALLFSLFKRVRVLNSEGGISIPLPLLKLMEASSPYDVLEDFYRVDDPFIFHAIQTWTDSKDTILSDLSRRLLNRVRFKALEITGNFLDTYQSMAQICEDLGFDPNFYIVERTPKDVAYSPYDPTSDEHIKVLKDGRLRELSSVMPTDTLKSLSREVMRKYLFVPEECWRAFKD